MKTLFIDLIKSLNTNEGGLSARKLTSFALMACVAYIHLKYVNPDNAIEALIIDLTSVFLLLGIITAEQIIKFKGK